MSCKLGPDSMVLRWSDH